ncbi:MAG: sigma-70 family RNA polymerase sigma factor [Phycisphaerae bacterium]|nr:sigma-70 family RNA polymerase sigma factor [Phycisphaerae bacterium]
MIASKNITNQATSLAQCHLPLAKKIAGRLRLWYNWVDVDDLHGYAFLGLALAAKIYEPDRGIPFDRFAIRKAMFLAIDEMRKDGVLRRRNSKVPHTISLTTAGSWRGKTTDFDIADEKASKAKARLEARDLCEALLKRLRSRDRQLLLMYYSQDMTFKEIAEALGISESAVCLQHKSLIGKLRRTTKAYRFV